MSDEISTVRVESGVDRLPGEGEAAVMTTVHTLWPTSFEEALPRFVEYFRRNPSWGALHFVLYDGAVEDSDLLWHRDDWCKNDQEARELCRLLLAMTVDERQAVITATTGSEQLHREAHEDCDLAGEAWKAVGAVAEKVAKLPLERRAAVADVAVAMIRQSFGVDEEGVV